MKRHSLRDLQRRSLRFTLLELLVVISLLAIVSGWLGVGLYREVEAKRFRTAAQELSARLTACQRLAVAKGCDIEALLLPEKRGGTKWVFRMEEGDAKVCLSPLHLAPLEVKWEGKRVSGIAFSFYASGRISPQGELLLTYPGRKELTAKIDLKGVSFQKEGDPKKEIAPLHPHQVPPRGIQK